MVNSKEKKTKGAVVVCVRALVVLPCPSQYLPSSMRLLGTAPCPYVPQLLLTFQMENEITVATHLVLMKALACARLDVEPWWRKVILL